MRPIKTWFPFGSTPVVLNLASTGNSPDRSTKSTPSSGHVSEYDSLKTQGFPCPVVLWYSLAGLGFRLRVFHTLWMDFPKPFDYPYPYMLTAHNPGVHAPRFGLHPFRSPLLRISIFLSFHLPT